MVKYRQFSPRAGDLLPVIKFVNRVFRTSYNPSVFMNLYNLWNEGFILAKEGGRIVGLMLAVFTSTETTRILLLGVAETHRNCGIGAKLLHILLTRAAASGATQATLEVRHTNTAAIAFYEKFGFSIRYVIPMFYKDNEHAYVMDRLLLS